CLGGVAMMELLCYGAVSVYIFFFFQAEDGIRDWSVTGVQTCALPIWRRRDGGAPRGGRERRGGGVRGVGEGRSGGGRESQRAGPGRDRRSQDCRRARGEGGRGARRPEERDVAGERAGSFGAHEAGSGPSR